MTPSTTPGVGAAAWSVQRRILQRGMRRRRPPSRRAAALTARFPGLNRKPLERNVVPTTPTAATPPVGPLVEAARGGVLLGRAACATGGAGAAGAALTAGEEPDRVGHHLHAGALLAGLLVVPCVGLEPPFDVDLPPLGQELPALLRLLPPDLDVMPLRLLLLLARLLVGPAAGGGDAEVGDRLAAGGVADLGILAEVPHEDDLVDHERCSLAWPAEAAGVDACWLGSGG